MNIQHKHLRGTYLSYSSCNLALFYVNVAYDGGIANYQDEGHS